MMYLNIILLKLLPHLPGDNELTQRVYIDGLVQERRNSIANAMELRLSCSNPLIWQFSLNVKQAVSL